MFFCVVRSIWISHFFVSYCVVFCATFAVYLCDANNAIEWHMARNEIRKSGAGILEKFLRRFDSDILFSSWLYMPSDHEGFSRDAIKSMLPLLPTGMILRKYLWEVENDRQRERTTKKSFRLIPITRCLDTLLCCNFSFSSFRHVYSCLFFMVRDLWRQPNFFVILIWVWVSSNVRSFC